MKIGIFVSDTGGERTGVEELQRRAQWVEENGFTSAWVPHIPWSLDALTALTLASNVTERIELGTAVVPTYPRHPLALAQQALSVQAASNGRLALGIGPSHPVVTRIRLVDYRVRILDGQSATAATTRVLIDSSDGPRRWSTVGAGTDILAASWAALADSFEFGIDPVEEAHAGEHRAASW